MSARPPPAFADLDAVTVDVDGTIYDLTRMRRRAGLLMIRHLKLLRAWVRAREAVRRMGGLDGVQALRAEQTRRVAAELGIPAQEAAEVIERLVYRKYFDLLARFRPFAGARDALERCVARGLKLAVVSDFDAMRTLQGMGLADLPWVAVVDAEQTGHLKPQPQPFERALEALGVPPERVLHVGDREDCDVDGALRLGMRAALLVPRGAKPDSRADLVVASWAELVTRLERAGPLATDAVT